MAYAPTKNEHEVEQKPALVSDFAAERRPDDVALFNPILQSWEAAKSGQTPSVPLVMTDEERASRRAILANPGPPSRKLIAALAERRRMKRAANEI